MQPFEIENAEELRVRKENTKVLPEAHFLVLLRGEYIDLAAGYAEDGGHLFKLRKVQPHCFRKGSRYTLSIIHSFFIGHFIHNPVDILPVRMECVKTQFVPDHIKK